MKLKEQTHKKTNLSIPRYKYLKKVAVFLALIVPITIVYTPVLISGNKLLKGDFDMQIQMTEAARQSIAIYHQFPFWNPWVAGGVPLFADPQFGLITPQTILSIFIGSVLAWKITIVIYSIVGFFGMKKLLTYVSSNIDIKNITLLSYIWVLGSFFIIRSTGGHFTFIILSLLPYILFFGLNITKSWKYFFWFSSLIAYSINAALHYSTIMMLIFVALFIAIYKASILIFQRLNHKDQHTMNELVKFIILFFGGLVIAITVNIPRIYLSLEYLHDEAVKRTDGYEKYIGFINGVKSIIMPYQHNSIDITRITFSAFEASNYIGLVTGLVFVCLLTFLVINLFRKTTSFILVPIQQKSLLISTSILAIISFVLGLGGVPFKYLRLLPVFSSTRVSTRWFFITSFCILILICILTSCILAHRKYRLFKIKFSLANIILLIAFMEVFYFALSFNISSWTHNKNLILINTYQHSTVIKQEKFWHTIARPPTYQYFALTEATRNNIGQIIADNALVDTRLKHTNRCDSDADGCNFIMSNNATVTFWSPNRITLHRTAPGAIRLNMNPGSHWKVNGKYIFTTMPTVDPEAYFIVNSDDSVDYQLEYMPIPRMFKN